MSQFNQSAMQSNTAVGVIEKKKKLSSSQVTLKSDRIIVFGIFVLYTLFLIEGLLFKFQTNFLAIKKLNAEIHFYWLPRFNWTTTLRGHLEVWGNLAIFIPFGCLFSIINGRSGWRHLIDALVICSFSVFIEVSQSLFCVGEGDIRDIILNTAGGVIGIYFYRLIELVFKKHSLLVFAIGTGIAMVILTSMSYTYMGGGYR